jgi:small nuclear ribonucleoprotein (snRNP)-like protein
MGCSLAGLQGTLKGYDQTTNLVLENCHERVYSPAEGVEQIVLGLYIMRGDSMYVVSPSVHLQFPGHHPADLH